MKRILLMIAIVCLAVTPASAALFQNGSFENGSNPPVSGFSTLAGGSTDITGWTVGGSGVDWVGSYWNASQGARSIDLSSTSIGWISQSFSTTPNTAYRLSFDMAGNPEGGSGVSKIKNMLVTVGGNNGAFETFSFDTTGKTTTSMGWANHSFVFTALSGQTTLTFMSLEPSAYGPAIDNVNVATVPIPPAVWLLGTGLVGLVAIRRKRTK